jgi:hypothetical protein
MGKGMEARVRIADNRSVNRAFSAGKFGNADTWGVAQAVIDIAPLALSAFSAKGAIHR